MAEKDNKQKKDNFFRLEEMHESMKKSLENIVKVKAEQKDLIEIVKASDKADKFETFIKEVETEMSEMDKQYCALMARTTMLGDLLTSSTNEQKQTINMLLSILNVFGNE